MPENTVRKFTQRATPETLDQMEQSKISAQEGTMIMEQSYVTASKGAIDFNLKLMDMAQDNINAAFEFARLLSQVNLPSTFFEVSAEHACKQVERLTAQTRDLTGVAQKTMTETTRSLQKATIKAV